MLTKAPPSTQGPHLDLVVAMSNLIVKLPVIIKMNKEAL